MKFKILGKAWTLYTMNNEAYAAQHGTDSIAITDTELRAIYLSEGGRHTCTIVHELTHAYMSEMCVSTTTGGFYAFEEFFAEFVATHAKEILATADDLVYRIRHRSRRRK